MKPQALQDAIKAAALKKTKKKWVEPVIKQHKITAEEFTHARRPSIGLKLVDNATPSIDNNAAVQNLQNLLAQEREKWAKERDCLLSQMKALREDFDKQMEDLRQDMHASTSLMRKELKTAQKEMARSGTASHTISSDVVEELRQDLHDTQDLSKSQGHSIEALRRELDEARKALKLSPSKVPAVSTQNMIGSVSNAGNDRNTELLTKSKSKSKLSPKSPNKKSKSASQLLHGKSPKSIASINLEDHPKTPSKAPRSKADIDPIKPGMVSILAEAQKKDKSLKEFLKTKGTSGSLPEDYTVKSMKIKEYVDVNGETRHLVCFHQRVYVPEKIRSDAMQHYYKNHPHTCTVALQQHCIWPECEREMKAYKKQARQNPVA